MVDLTTVAFTAAAAAAAAEPKTTFQSALHGAYRARMKSIPKARHSVGINVQVHGII